ncbi:hypothetical protein ACFYXQ_15820 [Nocardia jiangxiensis]|uniref:Uncharacterized protein n=1 Tax=Nocardia jiangxiensis TaxID=282685 RepID=A0ABW6RYZ2_9NOCA
MEPDREDLEMAMRRDFVRVYRLRIASEFARTPADLTALETQADQIAEDWLGQNGEWSQHWQYLDEACDRFRNEPADARASLTGLANPGDLDPDPATAATKLASLKQAAIMDDERRIATAPPRGIDEKSLQPLPYTAMYAPDGRPALRQACTSWWQAREWIRDNTYTHPKTPVDIEIRARDTHTGDERVLMSAHHAEPSALRAELTRVDRVLGGGREVDGKPWIDELSAEILADGYHKALQTQLNPWGAHLRFEHQLHADDLRDQYLDFTTHAGINSGAEHLAEIDDAIHGANLYGEEPAGRSWLDEAITYARHLPGNLEQLGVDTHYQAPDDPAIMIAAGRSMIYGETPWYAEVRIAADHGGWVSGDRAPAGRYATCGELMTALQQYGTSESASGNWHFVPAEVASALWGFDNQLTELNDNLVAAQHICHGIRTSQAYQLRCSQTTEPNSTAQPANSTTAEPNRSPTAEANHSPTAEPPDPSKAVNRNRERARQRRQRTNRQPRRNTQSRRRRP